MVPSPLVLDFAVFHGRAGELELPATWFAADGAPTSDPEAATYFRVRTVDRSMSFAAPAPTRQALSELISRWPCIFGPDDEI